MEPDTRRDGEATRDGRGPYRKAGSAGSSSVFLNQSRDFFHDFGHRGTVVGVLSPHVFHELDDFWAPAVLQTVDGGSRESLRKYR